MSANQPTPITPITPITVIITDEDGETETHVFTQSVGVFPSVINVEYDNGDRVEWNMSKTQFCGSNDDFVFIVDTITSTIYKVMINVYMMTSLDGINWDKSKNKILSDKIPRPDVHGWVCDRYVLVIIGDHDTLAVIDTKSAPYIIQPIDRLKEFTQSSDHPNGRYVTVGREVDEWHIEVSLVDLSAPDVVHILLPRVKKEVELSYSTNQIGINEKLFLSCPVHAVKSEISRHILPDLAGIVMEMLPLMSLSVNDIFDD